MPWGSRPAGEPTIFYLGICAPVLLWCKALEQIALGLREAAVTQQNRKFVVENRAPLVH